MEIIFPNEVLPDWNTENPIAQTLVANGVGIFFTDDNLTTVIDIVDGSSGVATDITNNELGEEVDGYRVGVAITSLTVEAQASVTANPYQLFKTAETVQDEYALKWGSSDQGLLIANLVGSTRIKITLAGDMPTWSANTYLSDCRLGGGSGYIFYHTAAGFPEANITVNGAPVTNTNPSSNMTALWNAVKGDVIEFDAVGMGAGNLLIGTRWTYASGRPDLFLADVHATDDNGLHLFDLNQTYGDVVYSHTSLIQLQLVNFPLDSGYIVENGVVVGYQFDGGVSATLALVGAYTGTITYSDDSTLAISGSGNYVVNTGIVKSIDVTDTVNTYYYDGVSGDDGKLLEVNHGNHAVISGASDVKWQRILDKRVVTLGTNGDYSSLANHRNGEKSNGERLDELIVLESQVLSAEVRYYANEFHNLTLRAKSGSEFNGVLGHADNIKIESDGVMSDTLFQLGDTLTLQGLDIRNEGGLFYQDYNSVLNIVSSGVHSETGIALFGRDAELYVKDSMVKSDADRVFYDSSANTKATLINNILIGNVSAYGTVRNRFSATVLQNNVIQNLYSPTATAVGDESGGLQGSNNVGSGSSVSALGIGADVDFDSGDGAFVNTPIGDLRINQAWADTNLVGQGWNGSDIASWSYYTASGLLSVYSDVDIRNQILSSIYSDADIRNQILSALSSVISDLDVRNSVYNKVLSDSDIRNTILSTTISDVDFRNAILSYVQNDIDIRTGVLQSVSSTVDVRNKILSSVFNDVDIRTAILNSVWSDVDLRNEVLSAAGYIVSDLDIRSAISGKVISDVDVRSEILTSIDLDIDLRNKILQAITKDTDVRASILTSSYQDFDYRNNILGFAYADIDIRNDIDAPYAIHTANIYSFSLHSEPYSFTPQNKPYSFTLNDNQYSF